MITFERSFDYGLIHAILTDPSVYPSMGDDSLPPREQFEVNRHLAIHYVKVEAAGRGILGLFMLCPENSVCWQLHVCMLPGTKAEEKWAAAREFIPWLKQNTECRRLTAAVPSCNQRAVIYGTHGLGMNYIGRHEQAFARFGVLHDLILLGRSIPISDSGARGHGVYCKAIERPKASNNPRDDPAFLDDRIFCRVEA